MKILKVIALGSALAFSTLVGVFFFLEGDSELYTENTQAIKDNTNLGRPVYQVEVEDRTKVEEVKEKKEKTKKYKSTMSGTFDASIAEVLSAVEQIIGNLDDAYIKGNSKVMTKQQIKHIKAGLPGLIAMSLKYNIFVSTGIVQTGHETGWGKYLPKNSNNYFGIKAFGKTGPYWDGRKSINPTNESADANTYQVVHPFRVYDSLEQSIMDYGEFLKVNPLYTDGGRHLFGLYGDDANTFTAPDAETQMKRILNAGYAPGSENKYLAAFRQYHKQLDLGRFDKLRDQVKEILDSNSSTQIDEDSSEGSEERMEGEWTPSGDVAWLEPYGATSKMNATSTKLMNYAKQYEGMPYIFGAVGDPLNASLINKLKAENRHAKYGHAESWYNTHARAFDCSGLTSTIYKEVLGVDIGRNTYAQVASPNLKKIPNSEARPGDVILTNYGSGGPGHAALYMGQKGGKHYVFHASNSRTPIGIGVLNKSWTTHRSNKLYPD